jgi:hypothetical protein
MKMFLKGLAPAQRTVLNLILPKQLELFSWLSPSCAPKMSRSYVGFLSSIWECDSGKNIVAVPGEDDTPWGSWEVGSSVAR